MCLLMGSRMLRCRERDALLAACSAAGERGHLELPALLEMERSVAALVEGAAVQLTRSAAVASPPFPCMPGSLACSMGL